jgi:hypothetical protein
LFIASNVDRLQTFWSFHSLAAKAVTLGR